VLAYTVTRWSILSDKDTSYLQVFTEENIIFYLISSVFIAARKTPHLYCLKVPIPISIKGEVYLLLNYLSAMPWGSGGVVPPILTSPLDGGLWSASLSGRYTPGTHCLGGWFRPRDNLDAMEKRNNLPPLEIEPRSSSPQPFALSTERSRLPQNKYKIFTFDLLTK
jgi:hypothetical protein